MGQIKVSFIYKNSQIHYLPLKKIIFNNNALTKLKPKKWAAEKIYGHSTSPNKWVCPKMVKSQGKISSSFFFLQYRNLAKALD